MEVGFSQIGTNAFCHTQEILKSTPRRIDQEAPCGLRLKGMELQRCIRKKRMVGNRMFVDDLSLDKRISFLQRFVDMGSTLKEKAELWKKLSITREKEKILCLMRKEDLNALSDNAGLICNPLSTTLVSSRC